MHALGFVFLFPVFPEKQLPHIPFFDGFPGAVLFRISLLLIYDIAVPSFCLVLILGCRSHKEDIAPGGEPSFRMWGC